MVSRQNRSEISLFLDDAAIISQWHLQTIILAPLQLYPSLLIFTPKNSKVRVTFEEAGDEAKWICIEPQMEKNWGHNMQTITVDSLFGSVPRCLSVMFSPDSAAVASSPSDESVRIWNIDTGMCVLKLKCGNSVTTVIFSYDSLLAALRSLDTVQI